MFKRFSSTRKCLDEVFESIKPKDPNEIPFDDETKFVLFSDCHRGDGGWADDFADNQNLLFHSLKYYLDAGYIFIEVGDGEDLWEIKKFEDIRQNYSNIYGVMREFYLKKRLYLVWGNHNREFKDKEYIMKNLYCYREEERSKDPSAGQVGEDKQLFSNGEGEQTEAITVYEGLKLQYQRTDKTIKTIFVTHGHQGSLFNDGLWWVGRYAVRNIWRLLQRWAGWHDPTSPAKNNTKKETVENNIQGWVKARKNQMIIVGHTHRPWFPHADEPPYYNCGSGVHPRCITGIEIENGQIALVKWSVRPEDTEPGTKAALKAPLFIIRDYLEPLTPIPK